MLCLLDEEFLDGVLEIVDLRLQLRAVVGGDRARDDGTGNSARATQRLLGRNEDVRHVLILGEKREVKENLERFGVGGEDDELGDAAVESLCRFVRALLELLVVLKKVKRQKK